MMFVSHRVAKMDDGRADLSCTEVCMLALLLSCSVGACTLDFGQFDSEADAAADTRDTSDGTRSEETSGSCPSDSDACGEVLDTGQDASDVSEGDASMVRCTPEVGPDAGLVRSCYSGPDGTAGIGVCRGGEQHCNFGSWGTCSGEVTPSDEVCNGKDDDCDGRADESLPNCGEARAGSECEADAECRSEACVSSRCAHRVFVTSESLTGDLDGLEGADRKCNALASAAELSGAWRAIISGRGTDARSRIAIEAAVYNIAGEELASGRSDLWDGSLDQAVGYTENGDASGARVWTATSDEGTYIATGETSESDCSSWSSASQVTDAAAGLADKSDSAWMAAGEQGCDERAALYCIDGQ